MDQDIDFINKSLQIEIWEKIDWLVSIFSEFPTDLRIYHELFLFVSVSSLFEELLENSFKILNYTSIRSNLLELIIKKTIDNHNSPTNDKIISKLEMVLGEIKFKDYEKSAHELFTKNDYSIHSIKMCKDITRIKSATWFYRCEYSHHSNLILGSSRLLTSLANWNIIWYSETLSIIKDIWLYRQKLIDYHIILSIQFYLSIKQLL